MSSADEDELFERLLSGDLDPASPEALRLFEDAGKRLRFAELGQLAASLEAAGREQRAVLAVARDAVHEAALPGAERVEPVLSELARSAGTRPRGLPWRLLAAAAVLFALFGSVWWLGSEPVRTNGDERFLGGEELELGPLERTAGADGRSVVRWRSKLPAGGWYTLEIWAADAPEGALPLVRETELEESEWTTSEDLPANLRIRVRAFGPGGLVRGVLDERSPP